MVVNCRFFGAFYFFDVRLDVVVIWLAFRYVVEDRLDGEVLSDLRPALEVSLAIAYVVR